MRILTFLVILLSSTAWPAQAAVSCVTNPELCRCVGVVYEVDSSTVDWFLIPWSEADSIGEQLRVGGDTPRNIAGFHVYYDQFGNQGGPSWFSGWDERYTFTYIPPTAFEPREGLLIGEYFASASAQSDSGSKSWFVAALDATEDVSAPSTFFSGRLSNTVLDGGRTGTLEGGSEALSDLAFSAGSRATTGEIWDEILLNGCP